MEGQPMVSYSAGSMNSLVGFAAMEWQPMVSYWAGSMNSLVDKLTKLKTVPPEIGQLKQDLENLDKNFFRKVAAERRDMDPHVQVWMKHVRELVFDIEGWVDLKMGVSNLQLEIEEEVPQFTGRIVQLCELCQSYRLVTGRVPADHLRYPAITVPSHGSRVDSRILFGEETVLVRGRKPRVELVKLLTAGENHKRVVSIVGMEGLGKTTLAKEIYAELLLEGQFDCWASVSVGKRPSMRNTLMEISRQVMLCCEKERVNLKPDPPMYAAKDR